MAAPKNRSTRDARGWRTRLVSLGVDKLARDDILLAFGQNLKSLRTVAGLSQKTLAIRCFLRHDHISALERGLRAPDLLVLLMLADAIGVPVGDLTAGLAAPNRQAGRDQALAVVTSQPGISTEALADLLLLPHWYVTDLIRFLESIGSLTRERTGWRPTTDTAA